ncbi:hypothetical protein OF83DRAFT_598150 [Amylostereum chailletii]|nr:hypothetical protein OF83DRAFT_598150 [Amylostereum chailletii]
MTTLAAHPNPALFPNFQLPPEITCLIVCSLIDTDVADSDCFRLGNIFGYAPAVPQLPDDSTDAQRLQYAYDGRLYALDTLGHELRFFAPHIAYDATSPHSISVLSNTFLLRRLASRTVCTWPSYTTPSGDTRRCVARLVISWERHTAIVINHNVLDQDVNLGPYFVSGSSTHPPLHWHPQVQGRLPPIDLFRRHELACRLNALNTLVQPPTSTRIYPHSAVQRAAQTTPLHGDFINPRGVAHRHLRLQHPVQEAFEPLLHLRAGEHGYFFPALQPPPYTSRAIPTHEVDADVPLPGQPFQLFVGHDEDEVEYLGRYERVPSARLWTWRRMTPDEWEGISEHPTTQAVCDAILERAAAVLSEPVLQSLSTVTHHALGDAEDPRHLDEVVHHALRAEFRCGKRTLDALFLQFLHFDARVEHALHLATAEDEPP